MNKSQSGVKVAFIKLTRESVIYLFSASLVGSICELIRGARMEGPVDYFPVNVLFVAMYAATLAIPAIIAAIAMCIMYDEPPVWVRVICALTTSIILVAAIYKVRSLIGAAVVVGVAFSTLLVLTTYWCGVRKSNPRAKQ